MLTTLSSRYSVFGYIFSLLAVRQELAVTGEAISDITVVCHFLFEPYHDRSKLPSAFSKANLRRSGVVMLELLRHPTPKLTRALEELRARLAMMEQLRCSTPEPSCTFEDVVAVRAW